MHEPYPEKCTTLWHTPATNSATAPATTCTTTTIYGTLAPTALLIRLATTAAVWVGLSPAPSLRWHLLQQPSRLKNPEESGPWRRWVLKPPNHNQHQKSVVQAGYVTGWQD